MHNLVYTTPAGARHEIVQPWTIKRRQVNKRVKEKEYRNDKSGIERDIQRKEKRGRHKLFMKPAYSCGIVEVVQARITRMPSSEIHADRESGEKHEK